MIQTSDSESKGISQKGTFPRGVVDAIAGAVAGGVARIFVSPLDVIKIRFQVQLEPVSKANTVLVQLPLKSSKSFTPSKYTGIVQAAREIVREEGFLGLWRGTVPGLLLVMPYTAIQFVVIHRFKSFLVGSSQEEDHKKLKPELSFLAGSVAGIAATVGSYPFDLVRTVLASQGEPKVYSGMRSAFAGIVKAKGISGLYSGLSPTIVEIIPYAGLQFGLYDSFKRWTTIYNQRAGKQSAELHGGQLKGVREDSSTLDPFQKFACGLAAGMLAKMACHPLDVVKKRFQVEGLSRHPRYGTKIDYKSYRGMIHALEVILKNEGWSGLYKGCLPSVLKAAPAAAITFFMYDLLATALKNIGSEDE